MYENIRTFINERDALARHLGIVVEEITTGRARASMPLADYNRNGLGNLHGGASFVLADIVFAGLALAEGMATVNIASSISFTAAGTCGPITAEARLISESRKLCTIEVRITDGSGTLVALFTGTGYKMGPFRQDLGQNVEPV